MRLFRCFPHVFRQVTRHRVRSLLTIAGIAIAIRRSFAGATIVGILRS